MDAQNESDFRSLAEHSNDLLCRVDQHFIMRYASPSCLRILGWRQQEMIGTRAEDMVVPDDLPKVHAVIVSAAEPGGENSLVTVRMRRKVGAPVWMDVNGRLVRDDITGEPLYMVLAMRDVTDRKALEEKLSALAMSDGLTGLLNRRAFDQELDREWSRTLREGSQISLVLLDLDHFKVLNDLFGHQVGDDCLRAVAAAVIATVRSSDLAARYGGEELAIILPDTDSASARLVAENLRSSINHLRLTHPQNLVGGGYVSASFGIATAMARDGGTTRMPESLLLAADNALYRAKYEGRNRVATALLVAPKSK